MLNRSPRKLPMNSAEAWKFSGSKSVCLSITKAERTSVCSTILFIVFWYLTAIVGTIINKIIMESFPFPITFSIFHLTASCAIDYCVLRKRIKQPFAFRYVVFRSCCLNGIFFALAKISTYLSYALVPVSLAHTVKSSGPVFTVIVTTVWLEQCIPWSEVLTLVPIVFGVTLSSVTEIHFDLLGFTAAVTASVFNALQTTSGKIVMSSIRNIDPIELHFYAASIATIGLIPLATTFELNDILVPSSSSGRLLLSTGTEFDRSEIPWFLIGASTVLYVQSMASLFVLERVTTVSHNVTNTLKRFLIIVISIFYFHNYVGWLNILGILLACIGFLSYAYVHSENKRVMKENIRQNTLQKSMSNQINSIRLL